MKHQLKYAASLLPIAAALVVGNADLLMALVQLPDNAPAK